jgi:predicted transcriptional regulator
MSKRTKTTIYLDSLQYRRLKDIAEEEGATAAEQIREAIDDYLTRRGGRRMPRSLASASSGRHDLSEKAEKLLRGLGRR